MRCCAPMFPSHPPPPPPTPTLCRTRALRSDYDLTTRQRPPLLLRCKDAARAAFLASCGVEITTLAYSSSLALIEVGGGGGRLAVVEMAAGCVNCDAR